MIVFANHVVGIAVLKTKRDTKLVSYADTVLPCSGTLQGFEPITRRATKITQHMSGIQHIEFALDNLPNALREPTSCTTVPTVEYILGRRIAEGSNHSSRAPFMIINGLSRVSNTSQSIYYTNTV